MNAKYRVEKDFRFILSSISVSYQLMLPKSSWNLGFFLLFHISRLRQENQEQREELKDLKTIMTKAGPLLCFVPPCNNNSWEWLGPSAFTRILITLIFGKIKKLCWDIIVKFNHPVYHILLNKCIYMYTPESIISK